MRETQSFLSLPLYTAVWGVSAGSCGSRLGTTSDELKGRGNVLQMVVWTLEQVSSWGLHPVKVVNSRPRRSATGLLECEIKFPHCLWTPRRL